MPQSAASILPASFLSAMALLLIGCAPSDGTPNATLGKERVDATTEQKATASERKGAAAADKQARPESVPLIPREVLFGNPQKSQARLSPDGKWISFQAPVEGVMNVWVGPADDFSKAQPVTKEKVRPIPSHSWAYDNKHVLYVQDKNGDENYHLYATNVETLETKDLTPIRGV